jgi:hypothetical protein
MGGPIQGNHPDKWCGIHDPVESYILDGGTPGPNGTLSGNHSGQVALKREQLGGDHHENQATGKVGEADRRYHRHSPQERKMAVH